MYTQQPDEKPSLRSEYTRQYNIYAHEWSLALLLYCINTCISNNCIQSYLEWRRECARVCRAKQLSVKRPVCDSMKILRFKLLIKLFYLFIYFSGI